MKPVLVDSDILIEISRARNADILARWDALSEGTEAVFCSPVTVAELWQGARPHERRLMAALFTAVACIPIDVNIGQLAGDYLSRYARSHHVELGDALIAATASLLQLRLWTRNRKHYPMPEILFY